MKIFLNALINRMNLIIKNIYIIIIIIIKIHINIYYKVLLFTILIFILKLA